MKNPCLSCSWNEGIARLRNEFGIREPYRKCGFMGYIETWKEKGRLMCAAYKGEQPLNSW
jgi:hypothetical protein